MVIKVQRWRLWSFVFILSVIIAGASHDSLVNTVKVIKKIPTTHKVVALTVDDGPHYKTTPELLKVLREKKVHVTLFVLGSNVEQHPEILAQAVADGHEIASHAYSHTLLTRMNQASCDAELDRAEKLITAVAPKPTLFRPPGGAYNDGVLLAARRHGYTTILWSVDALDWRRPSVNKVVEAVMTDIQPGSIVLLHDGQYPLPTPEAMAIIIDRLQSMGYEIVTVSELLQYCEKGP